MVVKKLHCSKVRNTEACDPVEYRSQPGATGAPASSWTSRAEAVSGCRRATRGRAGAAGAAPVYRSVDANCGFRAIAIDGLAGGAEGASRDTVAGDAAPGFFNRLPLDSRGAAADADRWDAFDSAGARRGFRTRSLIGRCAEGVFASGVHLRGTAGAFERRVSGARRTSDGLCGADACSFVDGAGSGDDVGVQWGFTV